MRVSLRFSLLLVFYEAIQWFHADGNYIFAPDFQETETKLSEISSEIMTMLRLSRRQSGLWLAEIIFRDEKLCKCQ